MIMKKNFLLEKQRILSFYNGQTPIEFYEEVKSTNDLAKQLQEKENGNKVYCAKRQTNGKGRFDRVFSSENGGIYLSYLFKKVPKEKVRFITPYCAVACAKALEKVVKDEIKIKWVNDLYSLDKKICGILCESKLLGNVADYVICGIGINVNTQSFSKELQNKASSLFLNYSKYFDASEICAEVIKNLDEFNYNFNKQKLLNEYRLRSYLDDKKVLYEGKEYNVKKIDDDFSLIIYNDFEEIKLSAGEVSLQVLK